MSSKEELALSMTGPPFETGLLTENDVLEIQEIRKRSVVPKSNFEQIPLRNKQPHKKDTKT